MVNDILGSSTAKSHTSAACKIHFGRTQYAAKEIPSSCRRTHWWTRAIDLSSSRDWMQVIVGSRRILESLGSRKGPEKRLNAEWRRREENRGEQ